MADKKLRKAAEQLRSKGRGGDSILAHINPHEAEILKAHGGSGTINPKTGLPEFLVMYTDAPPPGPGDPPGPAGTTYYNWTGPIPKKPGLFEGLSNEFAKIDPVAAVTKVVAPALSDFDKTVGISAASREATQFAKDIGLTAATKEVSDVVHGIGKAAEKDPLQYAAIVVCIAAAPATGGASLKFIPYIQATANVTSKQTSIEDVIKEGAKAYIISAASGAAGDYVTGDPVTGDITGGTVPATGATGATGSVAVGKAAGNISANIVANAARGGKATVADIIAAGVSDASLQYLAEAYTPNFGSLTKKEQTAALNGVKLVLGDKSAASKLVNDALSESIQRVSKAALAEGYDNPWQKQAAVEGGFADSKTFKAADKLGIDTNNKYQNYQTVSDALEKEGYSATQEQIKEYVSDPSKSYVVDEIRAKYDPLATTSDEAAEFFRTQGYTPTPEELQQYIGNKAEADTTRDITAYADPRAVAQEEASRAFSQEGYTPTPDQIKEYLGNRSEEETLAAIRAKYDPLATMADEASEFFQKEGYVPSEEELRNYVGNKAESVAAGEIQAKYDPLATMADEAAEFFRTEGYVPTAEELQQYVGNKAESVAAGEIQAKYDPLATMADEAAEFFKKEGYVPTAEELQQYVGNKAEADVSRDIYSYADPRAVIGEEASGAFSKEGYTPTQEQINEYLGNRSEEEALAAIQARYDPLATMADEAAEFFRKEGYTPSEEELRNYVGNKAEVDTSRDITAYADPLAVIEEEARSQYLAQGIPDPTREELDKYIQQRTESEVLGELDTFADPLGTTAQEARAFAAKYSLNPDSIDNLAALTDARTTELAARESLGEYSSDLSSTDPEYYDAQDRAYKYARSRGRSEEEAREFADGYAKTTLGRDVQVGDKPTLSRDGDGALFGGQEGSEEYFAAPGTRLATLEEVMADQASGAGKTYYDADANAWVTGVAPDIGELGSRTAVTTKDLVDYQSGDGSFRIPNPDGSYHMYSSQGVYMGVYTGDDVFIDYEPELSPFDVKPDFEGYPIQDFGGGEAENMDSFNDAMISIMEERGGFPVGWQQVGTDRVYIYDDGTGIGMNENGDPYALSEFDVTSMVDNGLLNTAASGYDFGSDTDTDTDTDDTDTKDDPWYKYVPKFKIPIPKPPRNPGTRPPSGPRDPGPRDPGTRDPTVTPEPPSASSPSSALQAAGSEKAQGSTLGKMPGSWVGGLGRPVSFIDPLSATEPDLPGQEESEDMYSTSPLAAATPRREEEISLQPEANYYSYGYEPSFSSIIQPYKNPSSVYAKGGGVMNSPLMAAQGGDVPHKGSHYVQGAGGGQDDLIDAKLADGEYVFDAEIVAALGDGSNKRGAEILDKWRQKIRKHKRSASINGIPPKAKSPLEYMKGIA